MMLDLQGRVFRIRCGGDLPIMTFVVNDDGVKGGVGRLYEIHGRCHRVNWVPKRPSVHRWKENLENPDGRISLKSCDKLHDGDFGAVW